MPKKGGAFCVMRANVEEDQYNFPVIIKSGIENICILCPFIYASDKKPDIGL